jgi:hypothetical protein
VGPWSDWGVESPGGGVSGNGSVVDRGPGDEVRKFARMLLRG